MTIQAPNMLVTLQQASDHLRRDTTDDDTDLEDKIMAASNIVLNYVGAGADDFINSSNVDSTGNPIIPRAVQAATLLMIGYLYKNREPADPKTMTEIQYMLGYLPMPVTALLYPYRTPTVL